MTAKHWWSCWDLGVQPLLYNAFIRQPRYTPFNISPEYIHKIWCIYIYIYVCSYILYILYIYIHMYIHIYGDRHTSTYIYVYLDIHMWIYIYTYVYVCIYIYTHTYTHTSLVFNCHYHYYYNYSTIVNPEDSAGARSKTPTRPPRRWARPVLLVIWRRREPGPGSKETERPHCDRSLGIMVFIGKSSPFMALIQISEWW